MVVISNCIGLQQNNGFKNLNMAFIIGFHGIIRQFDDLSKPSNSIAAQRFNRTWLVRWHDVQFF